MPYVIQSKSDRGVAVERKVGARCRSGTECWGHALGVERNVGARFRSGTECWGQG